jgi:RNA recognition motif-containing protein
LNLALLKKYFFILKIRLFLRLILNIFKQNTFMNLYLGNLPWSITDAELTDMLSAHGQVTSAKVVTDKFTKRSKGYGFAEMPNDSEATAAINSLNGREVSGRNITCNEARPREERPERSNFRPRREY